MILRVFFKDKGVVLNCVLPPILSRRVTLRDNMLSNRIQGGFVTSIEFVLCHNRPRVPG